MDDNDFCQMKCYLEQTCLSYNLGTMGSGDKFVCELSVSDHYQHPEDLVFKKGFSYHPAVKLCGDISCPPAASCVANHQGRLHCVCPSNWPEIQNCEKDSNECLSGSHDCSADAFCSNTAGSFTCICKTGFSGDGKICQNIDECATGSNDCHVDATCTDTEGSYNCACNDGVIGDGVSCVGFPFNWTLSGSDPFVSLYNGASYKTVDGLTALYLDGGFAYAETPAIPIQKISFSILCWVKTLSLPEHPVNIYSDWSTPFQFRLGIISGKLCINLRRASHFGPWRDIVYFCNGDIIINKWMHVAFTWSRENGVGKLYTDGVKTSERTTALSLATIDLNPTGHTVFDIGLKRDNMNQSTFHGYLRDLIVIDSALSEKEVDEYFEQSRIK
ncbi:sushi, von Willebrand factor type A, EGF and pentraxin domain-containing protein 1-like isoform X2 [Montipora foliosa]